MPGARVTPASKWVLARRSAKGSRPASPTPGRISVLSTTPLRGNNRLAGAPPQSLYATLDYRMTALVGTGFRALG